MRTQPKPMATAVEREQEHKRTMVVGCEWEDPSTTAVRREEELRSMLAKPSSRVNIAKLVLDKSISIQDVVAEMGKYLTATDNSIRSEGILFLGELMVKLMSMPLEDVTIQSLSSFFTARLADWPCLRGALVGCISLLKRSPQVGAVHEGEVKLMMKSVLENLHVQALGVNDRLLSLELFQCLLNIHKLSVASMGGDLVYGVCAAIEEEKDPRCLLLAFRLVHYLANIYPDSDGPLADCAGDIFDIVSRYFPLSFTPPPNDSRGISRDDLSGALLMVFTSTPLFAPSCIPFLLEKLSSTLQRAKVDSLRYLGSCACSFQSQSISGYTGAIWLALKTELIPPSVPTTSVTTAQDQRDAEVQEEALFCLTSCVETFQRGVEKDGSLVSSALLNLICEDECVQDLLRCVENDFGGMPGNRRVSDASDLYEGMESKSVSNVLIARVSGQTQATGRVLAAVARASPSSCYFVMEKLLRRLISATGIHSLGLSENVSDENISATIRKQWQNGSLSSHGLEVIFQMLEGASRVAGKMVLEATDPITNTWLEPVTSAAPILLAVFNELIMCKSLLKDQSKLGVAGLQALASFPAASSPLSKKEVHHVLTILVEILLNDTERLDLKGRSLKAILAISNLEEQFKTLSDSKDSNVVDVVTPRLLDAVAKSQSTVSLKDHLQALAAISRPRQIARQTVLTGFRQIVGSAFRKALVQVHHDNASQKLVTILGYLYGEIIPFCEKESSDQMAARDIILDIWSAIQSVPFTISDELLSALMAVNRVTIRSCSEGVQEKILLEATKVLLDQDRTIPLDSTSLQQGLGQDPATNLVQNKGSLAALVASITVGLLPAVVSPNQELLLKVFLNTSLSEGGSVVTSAAAQATASILNKWKGTSLWNGSHEQAGDTLEVAISKVLDESLVPVINEYRKTGVIDSAGRGRTDDRAVRYVYALAWTGKGLAMRGHARISDVATLLLMLLQSEAIQVTASVDELDVEGSYGSVVTRAAAESLGIILKDNPTCLNTAHNAVIRPFFKQRFFTSMLPPLTEAVRIAGSCSHRSNLFRAFGHLLSGTPLAAVLTEGRKVFPLILEGLSVLCIHSEDSDLLLSTLLALSAFLTDENNGRTIAENYVPAMVKRLVTLVQYRPSSVIRETALQCLAAIVGLPFILLFPVKPQVMKALTAALDDHKRSVRKEAVRCRRVWAAISSK